MTFDSLLSREIAQDRAMIEFNRWLDKAKRQRVNKTRQEHKENGVTPPEKRRKRNPFAPIERQMELRVKYLKRIVKARMALEMTRQNLKAQKLIETFSI